MLYFENFENLMCLGRCCQRACSSWFAFERRWSGFHRFRVKGYFLNRFLLNCIKEYTETQFFIICIVFCQVLNGQRSKAVDALAGELWEVKRERIRKFSAHGKLSGWDLRSVSRYY